LAYKGQQFIETGVLIVLFTMLSFALEFFTGQPSNVVHIK
jgi:hypothetical protein